MRSMRFGLRGGLLAGALLLSAVFGPGVLSSALADAAAEARFFDEQARAAFGERRYDAALALFLESHAAAPSAGVLYNIGVTAMLAHHEGLAYSHLDDFLASGSTDRARLADARQRMATLEGRLARIRVETDPPGALITVDRDELGALGRTPRTIVVDPGAHVVHLALDGHEPASLDVDVARGALVEASCSLAPMFGTVEAAVSPATARVVAHAPSGAEFVFDDATSLRLPVGPWLLRFEASGFVPSEREVLVAPDVPARLLVQLEAVPIPTGRLLVDTAGVAARVFVDGSPRAETPTALSLEVGAHEVRVEAEGHRPWQAAVSIEAGRARYLDLVLVPAR